MTTSTITYRVCLYFMKLSKETLLNLSYYVFLDDDENAEIKKDDNGRFMIISHKLADKIVNDDRKIGFGLNLFLK